MQISAIKPYFTTQPKLNPQTNTQNHTTPCITNNGLSMLKDTTYGQLLVKPVSKKVSFTGIEKLGEMVPEVIKKIPFEERLGSLMEIIDSNDVIIAAKTKRIANKLLNKSIEAFDKVIKRVFFLPEEKIPEAIAITRTDVAPTLINLGDTPLLVSNLESKNFLVGKKAGVWITPEAVVNLNNKFKFSVKEQSTENLSMMRSKFSEPYNLTTDVQPSIMNVNKKSFKDIFLEATAAPKTGLADVGGMDEVIKELKKNILYPIKNPELYANRKINHGIILYGPPGTGKTFLAKCLANDANASYFEVNAGSLRGGLVGQTEANWRKLFQEAIDNQPSIILVDECDAVFKTRSSLQPYAADELNQILGLISNLEKSNDQVFVISTTNKPELLDDAVLRAGRLGKQIKIAAPDVEGLKDIFGKQIKNIKIDENFNKDKFAEKLYQANLTGADTNQVIDNAYDIAFERLGIFEKMESPDFNPDEVKDIVLNAEDFEKGLQKHLEQNIKASGKNKRKPIGFTSPKGNPPQEIKEQILTNDPQIAAAMG